MGVRLSIRGVVFSYPARPVLRGVSLEVAEGELMGLVGPNGSGKTTLLRVINKILSPPMGTVMIGEVDVRGMALRDLARRVGYVPQMASPGFPLTVFEVVLLGRRPYMSWGVDQKDVETVARALTLLGLEGLSDRDFLQLSGGERQKVLLARALAQEPEVLLLDEPTSNLDLKHQLEVLATVRDLVRRRGMNAVVSIHDLNLAARFCDRLAVLHRGRIYAVGEPQETVTPEMIREVYGVEAVVRVEAGLPYVIPVAPVRAEGRDHQRRVRVPARGTY